jgi:hypothetical protein
VRLLQDQGLGAERVPLSGSAGGSYQGDISIALLGVDRIGECKSRRTGFVSLYSWLEDRDALVIKADRRNALVVLPLKWEPYPNVDDLNAQIPVEGWDLGLNGEPRPPWTDNNVVYLANPSDGALYTVIGTTAGLAIAPVWLRRGSTVTKMTTSSFRGLARRRAHQAPAEQKAHPKPVRRSLRQ